MIQPPLSQRPSVRSLNLPAPVEGAWLWLAEETERVLDAARDATGRENPGFTLVRVLENGAEVDYLLGWTEARSATVTVLDASRCPVAAKLVTAREGADVVARDGARVLAGRVIFRHHLEIDAAGRLNAISTSEGRLERRGDGRWRLLPAEQPAPNSRRGGHSAAA
jgi:hypothetical protein